MSKVARRLVEIPAGSWTATAVLSFAAALGVSAFFLPRCSGSAARTPTSRCWCM